MKQGTATVVLLALLVATCSTDQAVPPASLAPTTTTTTTPVPTTASGETSTTAGEPLDHPACAPLREISEVIIEYSIESLDVPVLQPGTPDDDPDYPIADDMALAYEAQEAIVDKYLPQILPLLDEAIRLAPPETATDLQLL